MQAGDENQVFEAFDVAQTGLERGQHLEPSFDLRGRHGLDGHALDRMKRAMDEANGLQLDPGGGVGYLGHGKNEVMPF
ncbi:hypothetical protein D3C72_2521230 [compost metagenome]